MSNVTSSIEISGTIHNGKWKFRIRLTFEFSYVLHDDGDEDENDD
jgi:hypothetical protein